MQSGYTKFLDIQCGGLCKMENIPGVKWVMQHPRFSAWVVLAVGMVALLVYEARNVGLETSQWIALIVATVLVAGACIWIISWEDQDAQEEVAEVQSADGEAA